MFLFKSLPLHCIRSRNATNHAKLSQIGEFRISSPLQGLTTCGGFCFYTTEMEKIINVPIALIRRCSDTKRHLECLTMAIIIKHLHENSTLYNINNRRFREIFGVSYYKAQSLIESAKESELFVFNERKNCLFAKSFKNKTQKHFKKGKFKGTSDFCKKINTFGNFRETVALLRDTLIESAVDAQERALLDSCATKKCSGTQPKPITISQFASAIGMSRTSAHRYVKRCVSKKSIRQTSSVFKCVIPTLNEETAEEYIKRFGNNFFAYLSKYGWQGWKKIGCTYSIISRQVKESFKHVIWNHKKRCSTLILPINERNVLPDYFCC